MDQVLSDIYFDPNHPGSFGGVKKLYDYAKLELPNLRYAHVEDWLRRQNVYTLHKPIRKRFQRNKIYVSYIDEQWECDLIDMRAYSRQNRGYNYMLVAIDSFSKFLFVEPLKTKKSAEVLWAFKKIFKKRMPTKLRSDKGGEFDNQIFREFCVRNHIIYFTTQNIEIKCAIVERVNRTLKSKLFRYFTTRGTRKYIDVLPELVNSYNNSVHRTIKMAPSDVDIEDEPVVFQNMYNANNMQALINDKPSKYKVGDQVRQKYNLNSFDKSYYPLWTDMVYTIDKVYKKHNKPQYSLDIDGQKLKKRYYPEELQKVIVDANTRWLIEKKLRYRTVQGQRQVLVKWKGYPSSYNQWIPLEQVQDL